MGRLKIILLLIFLPFFTSTEAQSIRNSIDGNDMWGAWFVEGTSQVWLVDSIPERARLWDYQKNRVLTSFDLNRHVKDINLLDDGSLAYVKHHDQDAYIVLRTDGTQVVIKAKLNAASYYIHPNGKQFYGSVVKGIFTYDVGKSKISKSKMNKNISGYSKNFMETNSPTTFLRVTKTNIEKIDMKPNGSLSTSVSTDAHTAVLNDEKNELLLISSSGTKCYLLPDLTLKKSEAWNLSDDFTSAVFDSQNNKLICSKESMISTYDLGKKKWTDSVDLGIGDVYFEDRKGLLAIGFSDDQHKFYIIDLQPSRL